MCLEQSRFLVHYQTILLPETDVGWNQIIPGESGEKP